MLNKLVIKNIALIDYAEIEFTKGLNVLSGETGSGKSVILESLNFVLGAKADKSLIRSGENECSVTAEFDVENLPFIKKLCEECEIEFDDNLIITRKFTLDGKSSIKLNGESINANMLKKFTSVLVDVHGQSEHFSLLKNSNQLKLIDKFGGDDIKSVKDALIEKYNNYKKIISELSSLGGDETQRAFRLDILNFQIKEIENVGVKEGEEETLKELQKKLTNFEKINTALSSLKDAFSGENSISDILSYSTKNISSISEFSDDYKNLYDRLYNVYCECEDLSETTSSLLDNMEVDNVSLDEVNKRLDDILSLKKKYGDNVNAINEYYNNAKIERERLENFNEIASDLLKNKDKLEKELYSLYIKINDVRKKYSQIFTEKVLIELKTLGMPNAKFEARFCDIPNISDCAFNSCDIGEMEFMFSANLGEPVKPLSEIISGGEMSRFMLATKSQSAEYNEISTYVFDEIDAGISGVIANTVAEKFIKISLGVQVIAISHLAQISAAADNNLLIIKSETNEKTFTKVKVLDEKGKIEEIIRLIGGDTNSETAILHAKDLISKAKELKR